MKKSDIFTVLDPVIQVFKTLNIAYYIGGSVASSAYGIARTTMDVDLVADLKAQHVESFTKLLESEYYLDVDTIVDAIRRRSSFNLVHLETMLKVDIFIKEEDEYDAEVFRRRREDILDMENETCKFYLSSPEDIVIKKLQWFRVGGEVSDRQWHDVIGVLRVQKNSLDMEYLRNWASRLGLGDLLDKAINDSDL